MVIPLRNKDSVHDAVMDVLMPEVLFYEQQYVLITPKISAIPVRLVSKPIGALTHCQTQVLAALDITLTDT